MKSIKLKEVYVSREVLVAISRKCSTKKLHEVATKQKWTDIRSQWPYDEKGFKECSTKKSQSSLALGRLLYGTRGLTSAVSKKIRNLLPEAQIVVDHNKLYVLTGKQKLLNYKKKAGVLFKDYTWIPAFSCYRSNKIAVV